MRKKASAPPPAVLAGIQGLFWPSSSLFLGRTPVASPGTLKHLKLGEVQGPSAGLGHTGPGYLFKQQVVPNSPLFVSVASSSSQGGIFPCCPSFWRGPVFFSRMALQGNQNTRLQYVQGNHRSRSSFTQWCSRRRDISVHGRLLHLQLAKYLMLLLNRHKAMVERQRERPKNH